MPSTSSPNSAAVRRQMRSISSARGRLAPKIAATPAPGIVKYPVNSRSCLAPLTSKNSAIVGGAWAISEAVGSKTSSPSTIEWSFIRTPAR